MYKIAVFFRKTARPNVFRKIILNTLSADFSYYLICSAFFQEPYQYKNGRVSGQFSTSSEIKNSLSTKCLTQLDFYGIYSSNPFSSNNTWDIQYRLFCSTLDKLQKSNHNLTCNFYKFKNKSHAKIFFAKQKDKIELAIIGSSNVSAGAFADRDQKQIWNHECNVIFWNDHCIEAKKIIDKFLDKEIQDSVFITNYDNDHHLNSMGVLSKLESIEEELSSNAILLNINQEFSYE